MEMFNSDMVSMMMLYLLAWSLDKCSPTLGTFSVSCVGAGAVVVVLVKLVVISVVRMFALSETPEKLEKPYTSIK